MRPAWLVFMKDFKIVFVIEFVARKDAELVPGPEERDRHHQRAGKGESVRLSECKILCHVRSLHPERADPARWLLEGPWTVAITAQAKTKRRQLASRPSTG
ncbi:hypothetical protein [Rhizobium sp. P007]|uniref:hypothetical protein n=1 Tax=Rhizobium sp. P007 TaxID=285908 RepID=UPI001FD23E71|nr:hypothetical protein [Rhizobium sp. P007]